MTAVSEPAGVFATVLDALTRPEAFFERRPEPSLLAPTGIVLLSAGLRIAVAAVILYTFRFVLPPGELQFALGVTVGLMVGYALVRWLLLAGIVYAVSDRLDGEGRFRHLLAYLGWSHLPNVFVGAVLLVVIAVGALGIDPPTSEAAVREFVEEFSGGPLVRLEAAAGMVSARTWVSLGQVQYWLGVGQFAWGAYLWFGAAKVGRNLDDRRALLAIAIPVLVTLLVAFLDWINVGVSL